MGCDIHIRVEVLRAGRWVYEPAAFPAPWAEYKRACEDDRLRYVDFSTTRDTGEPNPEDRCYAVFSILAGLRGEFPQAIPTRGLPEDAHDFDPYDEGWDHSVSWATLRELRALDWHGCEGSEFLRWLRHPNIQALADEAGEDGVRVLFGFDS